MPPDQPQTFALNRHLDDKPANSMLAEAHPHLSSSSRAPAAADGTYHPQRASTPDHLSNPRQQPPDSPYVMVQSGGNHSMNGGNDGYNSSHGHAAPRDQRGRRTADVVYNLSGPTGPTTAVSRQNSISSAHALVNGHGATEQVLRQTLMSSAPNSRPGSRASSRRRPSGSMPRSPKGSSGFGGEGWANGFQDHDEDHLEGYVMRHGFQDEYNSEDYLAVLEQIFYMYYTDKRHETGGNPKTEKTALQEWRMKDRLKTVSAALVLCLNLGVDPPDVVKTNPSSKMECWVDPTVHAAPKALELIGKNLQQQYETLSIRTRYKQYLDPFVEDTKKFCCALRRNAKDERILFHYNGHGVPRPTASGEIWVFNKNFTQYIPISLYDLQSWLGAPSLFVYDCSDAGNIVSNFNRFIEKHEQEAMEQRARDPLALVTPSFQDCIQLGACSSKETLPMNPELPADLFTCCLTTPIEIAVRFFVLQNPLPSTLTLEIAMKIPGRLQERRTPLGELNWIFTAITDTIAWNTLPRPLFKKLFRQDLMVAALFRNFLLSQRIMRVYHCHPISSPALPETHNHPLWQSWDLAIEMVLAQLPALNAATQEGGPPYEYQHSTFFTEQLTAFEVYLTQGAVDRKPPDQLPIVLQVLLSQVHRLRALILLSKFLDLGPWAVNLALSIGIFPYVLKLLQSAAQELKPVMVFIWARILAVDKSCQTDLLKDNGYSYFVQILSPNSGIPVGNASEHRAMCAFILAMFCRNYPQGQAVCGPPGVLAACLSHLGDENPLLRQWACLCISQLWVDYPEAKWQGIRESAHLRLQELVVDPVPEVRAAVLYALTTFLGIPEMSEEIVKIEQSVATAALAMTADGSSMVRKELVVFFSHYVKRNEPKFIVTAYEQMVQEREFLYSGGSATTTPKANGASGSNHYRNGSTTGAVIGGGNAVARRGPDQVKDATPRISENTIFSVVWHALLTLSSDPYPEVAQSAGAVIDYLHAAILESPLAASAHEIISDVVRANVKNFDLKLPVERTATTPDVSKSDSQNGTQPKKEGYLVSSLRRSASVAASLKNMALGYGSDTSSNGAQTPTRGNASPTLQKGRTYPYANGSAAGGQDWPSPPDANDYSSNGTAYHVCKEPQSRGFKPRDMSAPLKLPIESTFMDWSIEYFREPQMKPNEADEPGSVDYNQRLWRRTRNDKIIIDTQQQKERSLTSRWDHSMGAYNNIHQPTRLLFHQFESHLVAVDDKDTVSVWDWKLNKLKARFGNGNPIGTRVTEIRFLNEDDVALLMTGSGDGVVRIYRNYENEDEVELVSSWRALTDLLPSKRSSGLVADWQQGRGTLLIGGDEKVIRVWDAPRELCLSDIPARSGSCITSLTSEQVAGNIVVAGFGDGAVRVYDRRNHPKESMVKVWKEHKSWVVKCHMQRGGMRELVSADVSGEVRLWDIRMNESVGGWRAHTKGCRSLGVHEHAPVVATGSTYHDVKIWNMASPAAGERPIATVKPHTTFLQQNRSSPVTALAFHPHRMMMACSGAGDNQISMFGCDKESGI